MQQTLESLPANLARIQAMRADAGRSGDFQVTLGAGVTSIDDARRWADAGATRLLVTPYTNPRQASEDLHHFGDTIISKL
jgi:hypothetical protein